MKISQTALVTAAAGTTLAAIGVAIGVNSAKRKYDEFMKKSIVVQVADNAPDLVKLALQNMKLSVKIRELYDYAYAAGKKPAPTANYFKVTIQ